MLQEYVNDSITMEVRKEKDDLIISLISDNTKTFEFKWSEYRGVFLLYLNLYTEEQADNIIQVGCVQMPYHRLIYYGLLISSYGVSE